MPPARLDIRAPLRREDLPGLFARTCELLTTERPEVVRCDVTGIEPDAVCVDALARLKLATRRAGCRVEFEGASPRLRGLVDFMGLAEVLS
jgi:ABC-type transporter Mla MlaB component